MRNGQTINADQFRRAVAITLSDSTTYASSVGIGGTQPNQQTSLEIPDAWFVGVGGDLTIVDMFGNTTLLKNCVQGAIYYIAATKFKAAGTSATNLVALYY
jgi:hypothetical protein